MKTINFASAFFVALFALVSVTATAQGTFTSESGDQITPTPRDNFYNRYMHKEKRVLAYDYIHEKDVMWEKRIWREIDTRTLRNKHFSYEKQPFIDILLEAVQNGDAQAFSTFDDEFKTPLNEQEINQLGGTWDTVEIWNPETFEPEWDIVFNELDAADIKTYRVKEVWYFDEETSTMGVRILGIAPIKNIYDDDGNFLHSAPMFWVYYPELRHTLARTEAFNPQNDAMRMSWDDIFEARLFESHITKASNVHGNRLQDMYSGIDILLEADKVHNEIFNFEHDLWSY